MLLNTNIVTIDLKTQDRYRKILSRLGKDGYELKSVVLGDSDINYELSQDITKNRILNTPYSIDKIKFPLIYNGAGKGIKGSLLTFARFVDSNGKIKSLYNYPLNNTLTLGNIPPKLDNGFNWEQITFDSTKSGVILFFETLLDYYRDINNVQKRLIEKYNITVLFNDTETIPSPWQVIKDFDNGSILLAKDTGAVSGTYLGVVSIEGQLTKIKKEITFNF